MKESNNYLRVRTSKRYFTNGFPSLQLICYQLLRPNEVAICIIGWKGRGMIWGGVASLVSLRRTVREARLLAVLGRGGRTTIQQHCNQLLSPFQGYTIISYSNNTSQRYHTFKYYPWMISASLQRCYPFILYPFLTLN